MNQWNQTLLRDTFIKVNLSNIVENMKLIQEDCGPDVAIMAVVKGNAYGHGAIGVAPTLIQSGAVYLAVATLTEAMELRQVYPDYPIFILGHTPAHLMPYVVEHNFTQTLVDLSQAQALSKAAMEKGKMAKGHLKVDTGFHRLGISDVDELYEMTQCPNLEIEGIFSHFALVSDEENHQQYLRLLDVIRELESRGCSFRYQHIADSIALVDYPEYQMNMVRPGALVYGLRGSHKRFLPVTQCISFESRISQLHYIKEGEGVGYNYFWRAPFDTVIGTVPFGYADGYPRHLKGKGYVTIRGIKCPIIGAICMDQVVVDLSQIQNPSVGETAIIYGAGENEMTIQEASELCDTNKNDIIARLSARPQRVYVHE